MTQVNLDAPDREPSASVGASVHALQRASPEDKTLWSTFAGARFASDFCKSWLALQCGMISGARAGLLLLEGEDGRFATAAVWPDPSRDVTYLGPAAEQALQQRRGHIERHDKEERAHVAYPVEVAGRPYGVVVLDIAAARGADLQSVLRQLLWGVGWLETLFRRRQAEKDAARLERSTFAMDMLAGASEQ